MKPLKVSMCHVEFDSAVHVPHSGKVRVESLGVPRQGPQDVARLAFIQPPTHAPECQLSREGDVPM